MKIKDKFDQFAIKCSDAVGSTWMFSLALLIVITWGISGPLFSYSDTWQLIINTGTTIITFLMVFLIQHAQNREAQTTQLKLDELIRALDGARTRLVDLDSLSEEELTALKKEFERLGKKDKGAQPTGDAANSSR